MPTKTRALAATAAGIAACALVSCSDQPTGLLIRVELGGTATANIRTLLGAVVPGPGASADLICKLTPIVVTGLMDAGPDSTYPFPLQLTVDVDRGLAGRKFFAIRGFEEAGVTCSAGCNDAGSSGDDGSSCPAPVVVGSTRADIEDGQRTVTDTLLLYTMTCGDRIIDSGETCDDGNRISGDGCDPTCQLEPSDGGAPDGGDGATSTDADADADADAAAD